MENPYFRAGNKHIIIPFDYLSLKIYYIVKRGIITLTFYEICCQMIIFKVLYF